MSAVTSLFITFTICLGLCDVGLADNDANPEPKMVRLDSIHLVGDVYYGSPKRGAFTTAWDRFLSIADQIPNQKTQVTRFGYGVNIYRSGWRETGKLYYMTAVETTAKDKIPMMLFSKTLPASHYAVFDLGAGKRPGKLYRYIYDIWLPQSPYSNPYPYDFERYDEKRHAQIFIPVTKR